jgi:hypothetical protein
MRRANVTGMALTLFVGLSGLPSWGQVVETERDATITGPRGNTINRQITTERGPGFAERQVNIQRPGATLSRQTTVLSRPSGFVGGGGGWGPRPGYWGGPRFVERNVFVNSGPGWLPALAVGGGLFGLGLFTGSALAAPRPAVVVPPPVPVYVAAPQPVVVVNPNQPGATPPPARLVPDPLPDTLNRLHSFHESSRRDGVLALGEMRDPRAVPALIDRLKNDSSKDVRMASAWALAEIGDPAAGVALERAALFDKRKEVRDAAIEAHSRLPQVSGPANGAVPASGGAPNQGPMPVQGTALRTPLHSNANTNGPSLSPSGFDTPPPPPEPAPSPFGGGATSPK